MTVRRAELWWVGGGLAIASAAAPLPLYLVALAAFGLPHVLWELAWVRALFAGRLPTLWWWLVGGVLAVQAASRTAAWAGAIDASLARLLDLLTLALALAASGVLLTVVPHRRRLRVAVITAAVCMSLLWAVTNGNVVAVLIVLSVAHNFTPLVLAPANVEVAGVSLRRSIGWLFLLPWAVAMAVLVTGHLPHAYNLAAAPWQPPEVDYLFGSGSRAWQAVLSGLVLAQCLHYYCVIRLVPEAMQGAQLRGRARRAALVATAAMTAMFMFDFGSARGLYAVAAGIHAWLEWPLIVLLASGLTAHAATVTVTTHDTHTTSPRMMFAFNRRGRGD